MTAEATPHAPNALDSRIAELYREGFSIMQVVDELGCTRHRVQAALRELDVPRRDTNPNNRVGGSAAKTVRLPGPGITRLEPVGNCVLCRRRINVGQPYHRRLGLLGKVCDECGPL
jgi:hypothetical protein